MLCSRLVLPSWMMRDVLREQRGAFGHDDHVFGDGGGDDLLALVAARLVVVLDAVRALRLEAADMGEGVFVAVDAGEAEALGAVDDFGGGDRCAGR